MTKQTDREFFEDRVFRPETPCWNWRAYINRKGYGTWRRDGINTYVHRVAYELFVGPIPEGLEVHHACCNRSCVNPEHLQLLTHAENIAAKGRRTHCKHGHEFTSENTYFNERGFRYCRACRNKATRIANERKRRAEGQKDMAVECKHGHPRTPENTIVSVEGGKERRRCRECALEMKRKLRGPRKPRATHCPHGHEYTEANTYVYGNGYRLCRTCDRERHRTKI